MKPSRGAKARHKLRDPFSGESAANLTTSATPLLIYLLARFLRWGSGCMTFVITCVADATAWGWNS